MAIEKDVVATPKSRPKRVPVGSRNRLAVTGKSDEFEYRIVNDSNGDGQRIAQFKQAGYEFAPDASVSTERIAASSEGSVKSIPVGGGTTAYLMRIPKEYYLEDQANKQAHIDETERSMKQEVDDSGYRGAKFTMQRGN